MVHSILKFEADWCTPCKILTRTLKYSGIEDDYEIHRVNIGTEDGAIAAEQGEVKGIPTLLFLDENGKELDRVTGALTGRKLREIIDGL